MITNGEHLRQAREAMGFSHAELARALRLAGGDKQGEKRVREMEAGKRDISGPVTVAMEAMLRGFLPHDFKRDDEVAKTEPEPAPTRPPAARRKSA
jgi:transcriptional regulator with XRE-family HTH domain